VISVARSRRDTSRCEWCEGPIPADARADAKTCSKRCRQAKARFKVSPAPAPAAGATRPRRFAYADPPYPDCAGRYYRRAETDHRDLVARLMRDYPNGWALSTSAAGLAHVLAYCPKGTRVCPWVRGSRKVASKMARYAWEPLLVYGGRQARRCEDLHDALIWGGHQHSHPGALVGMKPAAFCEWMFRLLGAAAWRRARRPVPRLGRGHARVAAVHVARARASSRCDGCADERPRARLRGRREASRRAARLTLAARDTKCDRGRMRIFIVAALMAVGVASCKDCDDMQTGPGGCCKVCHSSQPCGDSCIPSGQTCNKGVGCACSGLDLPGDE
jgi:hypothetical protein